MTVRLKVAIHSPQRRALLHLDAARRPYFGVRTRLALRAHPTDRQHVVVDGETLPALAHRYLGDVNLQWVLADLNSLQTLDNPTTGTVLRIPDPVRLTQETLKNGNQ